MPRPTSKRSIVWKFFDVAADNKTITCKLCKKSYPNHGNTSNSKDHLKRIHPIQFHAEEDRRAGPVRQNSASTTTLSTSGSFGTRQVGPENTASSTQNENFQNENVNLTQNGEQPGSKHQRQLFLCTKDAELTREQVASFDKAVVEMIVKDYQPLSIVEDSGFRNLIRKLNPSYTLPSRKTLSEKLLPTYYTAHAEALKKILKDVEHIALTADYWKASNDKTFLSLTAHYIYDDMLASKTLAAQEVSGSHTATHTAAVITDILQKWNVYEKVVTVVTDNAANMKKAVSENLCKHHHPCVAHTVGSF